MCQTTHMSRHRTLSEAYGVFWGAAAYCSPHGHRVLHDPTCTFHTTKIRDSLLQCQAQTHYMMRRHVFVFCVLDTCLEMTEKQRGPTCCGQGLSSPPQGAPQQLYPCLMLVWRNRVSVVCQDLLWWCYCCTDQFSFCSILSN